MGQNGGASAPAPLSLCPCPPPPANVAHIPQRAASSASLATWVLSWVSCALSPPSQPSRTHSSTPPPRKAQETLVQCSPPHQGLKQEWPLLSCSLNKAQRLPHSHPAGQSLRKPSSLPALLFPFSPQSVWRGWGWGVGGRRAPVPAPPLLSSPSGPDLPAALWEAPGAESSFLG